MVVALRLDRDPIYRESDPRRVESLTALAGESNHGRGFAQGDFPFFEMASNEKMIALCNSPNC